MLLIGKISDVTFTGIMDARHAADLDITGAVHYCTKLGCQFRDRHEGTPRLFLAIELLVQFDNDLFGQVEVLVAIEDSRDLAF